MKVCKVCGFKNEDAINSCSKCKSALGAAEAAKPKKDFLMAELINLKENDQITGGKGIYLVKKHIADGGFGSVYCVQKEGVDFAMKVIQLRKILPDDREIIVKRFEREFEAGQIDSPFIVKSVDKGDIVGNPFIIMDFCPKGTLRSKMDDGINMSDSIRISAQILKGLSMMHKNGVIHKDLKPENVLFDIDGNARLTDFGISGFINNRETKRNVWGAAKTVFGTAIYAPPEQLKPNQAFKTMGPTNDIFPFGVILFEMLTDGNLPFGSMAEMEKDIIGYYKRMETGQQIDPETFKPGLQSFLKEIIAGCLKAEPKDRFQSADEILQKLGSLPAKWMDETQTQEPITTKCDWQIRIMNGDEVNRQYNLNELLRRKSESDAKRLLTLGWLNQSQPTSNDIGILENDTTFISRRHATLEPIEHGDGSMMWAIRDGQFFNKDGQSSWYLSTNGVLVNSTEAGQAGVILRPNDIITIGDTTMKVEIVD
ncbi:MAG: FHA domain-containing serine/threonine-protein kinase [Bacteroidota bacterium]|nr:FHA domain-containing serine/threonine-protein kinase [Bacteroidota bacterium]